MKNRVNMGQIKIPEECVMMKLIADSSSDRPVIPGADVHYVPLVVSTDECSFVDDEHLDPKQMLDHLARHKGRSYTACPSVDGWLQAYQGGDEIYAVTITSTLSGSYNAAMAARELYLQKYPGAKIAVFDSLSTGPELRLILEKLQSLTAQGLPFDQVEARTREYQKHTRLLFCLQSLHNMAQNGRVSKVAAAAVGVLGIRIVGTASDEGTLQQLAKCRGDRKALPELIEHMRQAGYTGGRARVTHVQNPALADAFVSQLRAAWPEADVVVAPSSGLCSYYAESGAVMVGFET